MSPEQAMAERVMDGRTDIYSLACVLYEMLAGQPPFVGANAQAVIARHTMDEVPPLTIVRASVPEGIEDAVMRALSKVPADRYATAAEFSSSLCGNGPRYERRTVARVRKRQPPARRRAAMLALVAVPLLAAAAGGLWWMNKPTSIAHASGLNPNRIAVLYLETEDDGDELRFLAEGLTESLIDELDRVSTLDVISAGGVVPFRQGEPRLDSVAAVLKTGTLVHGSVEEVGDRIRVAIRLVDGNSGTDFERATLERPKGDLLALRDTLSKQVALFLRENLGSEVQLREDRTATQSPEAWSLAQRAERARKDAAELVTADSVGRAAARIAEADSLLAAAEVADPRWVTPIVRRARLAQQQLRTTRDPLERGKLIATGLAHAERALQLQPRSAEALEIRGTLRFNKHSSGLAADPVEAATLVRTAEEDLRQSIAIDGNRATALNALSTLLHRTYERTEANLYAQRAYEADAYLAAAPDILYRLFTTSYDLQDFVSAAKWCDLGGERYPQQARFSSCQLFLMGTNVRQPNVPEAWALVDRVAERTPSTARDVARREAQMKAAVPIFRAGFADSARRVLERARAGRDVDPRGELIGAEAISRTLIGDHDKAIELLQVYLTSHPEHREGFVKANTWWWQPLKNDPRYKALVGIEH
jgi:serine/threonine-protein kinase